MITLLSLDQEHEDDDYELQRLQQCTINRQEAKALVEFAQS